MQSRPEQFFQFTFSMSTKDARLELEAARENRAVVLQTVSQISNLILGANLTPLQAQAVLVRAWQRVQLKGQLSLPTQDLSSTGE